MKHFLPLITFVFAAGVAYAQAPAENPEIKRPESASKSADPTLAGQPCPPPPFNRAPLVRVDVLMVSVPQEKALRLLPQLREPTRFADAEQQLIQMIERKEAVLEGWPDITTQSNVRAVSESIVEHRYPIEFEGPLCATCMAVNGAKVHGNENAVPVTSQEKAAAALLQLGGNIPTTFETRNTGTTLEIEPVVSPDGSAVTINLSPQVVRFERYAEFPAGVNEKGEKITIPQPIFTTSKVSSTVTLRDGERRLLHVGKATEAKTTVDIFIIGVKVVANPAPR